MRVTNDPILSWDIEDTTVTEFAHQLPPEVYSEWKHKAAGRLKIDKSEITDEQAEMAWQRWGPLYKEFSKILCISFAFFYDGDDCDIQPQVINGHEIRGIKVKTVSGTEEEIVTASAAIFNNASNFKNCGVNLKNFDIPFFCQVADKYRVKIPRMILNVVNEKWNYDKFLFDPQEYFAYGSFMNKFTRLGMICFSLGVPTPKLLMEGSDVYHIHYGNKPGSIEDICVYCEADTVSTLICSEIIRLNNQ